MGEHFFDADDGLFHCEVFRYIARFECFQAIDPETDEFCGAVCPECGSQQIYPHYEEA
ncbi:hypothetical protein [Cupriavidus sp. AcVe19-6a]|uniref:hypothetical protein n=1 Tax=Cupriavidus sp. AcVe19-6a TaxID=2821358 RepID=UPI001AE2C64D|nr:hypothetical protein [Cupriavidus sp. AcVe19-6a]MBP0634889.1 hypothetical protein [Cupriavidus sp. AcVe19-6a]